MSLSMGIPIGLVFAVIGGVLFTLTKYKRFGVGAIVFGLLITFGTLFVVFLVVNSSM